MGPETPTLKARLLNVFAPLMAMLAALHHACLARAEAFLAPNPAGTAGAAAAHAAPHGLLAKLADKRAQSGTSLSNSMQTSIVLAITFVVTLLFFPIVDQAVVDAQNATTDTTLQSLLDLVTILYIVVIILVGVGAAVSGFRSVRK